VRERERECIEGADSPQWTGSAGALATVSSVTLHAQLSWARVPVSGCQATTKDSDSDP